MQKILDGSNIMYEQEMTTTEGEIWLLEVKPLGPPPWSKKSQQIEEQLNRAWAVAFMADEVETQPRIGELGFVVQQSNFTKKALVGVRDFDF